MNESEVKNHIFNIIGATMDFNDEAEHKEDTNAAYENGGQP